MVPTDREQSGEFTLAPGVGLDTDFVVAGDHGETAFQVGDHRRVSLDLVGGREGVDVGELRPRDRQHLGGGVEFHRARSERDHRAVEREVTVAQATEVSQHLVLAVVAVEHRLGEELVGSTQRVAEARRSPGRRRGRRRGAAEGGDDLIDGLHGARLVEGHADRRGIDAPDVVAGRERQQLSAASASGTSTAIVSNHGVVDHGQPARPEPGNGDRRQPLDALGDPRQPTGPCHAA